MQYYADTYYEKRDEATRSSAQIVCPLVLELTMAKSLIDVGCGVGTWLDVFKSLGVSDVLGVEGNWVGEKYLVIPKESLLYSDLTLPLKIDRTFDLAMSLEVAEHLPAESAATFVESLVRLAPVILFSAAIPGQGGVNHVNEQWPEYWVKQFKDREYEVIDCIRRRIWRNDRVLWWYAKNILIFVRRDCLEKYPLLRREYDCTVSSQLSMVHLANYETKCEKLSMLEKQLSLVQKESMSVRESFKALIRNTINRVKVCGLRSTAPTRY